MHLEDHLGDIIRKARAMSRTPAAAAARSAGLTEAELARLEESGEVQGKSKVRVHSGSKSAPLDQRNRANDCIHLGNLRITHRDTPGHAEDGTTYIVGMWPEDAPHAAMVGDALFAGSIGRGNQSWDLARQQVREQILSLPPETLLCPGHGPLTTVFEEKGHNPFF